MKKTVFTFGLIAGAILAAMLLLATQFRDVIGFERSEVIGYTSMVVAFLLIFFGVRSYRDDVAGGTVRFGQALRVGALIAVVASLCYVAAWQLIYYKLAPGFITEYSAHVIEKERAAGKSDAEVAKKRADMEKFAELYKNPAINAGVTFLEPLPVALIIALVSAGVLSRRRKENVGGYV
jgi:hypothetical protein